jgi:pimeloyl-ACP methyl ester carboxylesterase
MAAAVSAPGMAQVSYPGTLEELKADVQSRAERERHPVNGYDPAVIREGLTLLQGRTEDDWAIAWMQIADRYWAEALLQEARGDLQAAMQSYQAAYSYYVLARWPTPTSVKKREAYNKGLQAFFAWDRLTALPTEVIEMPVGQETIVGLLRMPAEGARPAPLLVLLSGLDGYKENGAMGGSLALARQGIAVLSLGSPGTVQTVRASTTAWRPLMEIIDQVLARPDIDAARVVLRGGSWGSYWAAQLAHRYADRFIGVVAQGPAIHGAFAADWVQHVVDAGEYFFDWRIALAYAFGTDDLSQIETLMPPLSLQTQGLLDNPTPPMLLVNGLHDEVWPIDDTFLLLKHGTAKQAWVNPQGIHMGRQTGVWNSGRINQEIINPWILGRFGVTLP